MMPKVSEQAIAEYDPLAQSAVWPDYASDALEYVAG